MVLSTAHLTLRTAQAIVLRCIGDWITDQSDGALWTNDKMARDRASERMCAAEQAELGAVSWRDCEHLLDKRRGGCRPTCL